MKNNCPSCESENTQRLEVAFATHSTTVMGQMTAPPPPRGTTGAKVAMVIGVVIGIFACFLMMANSTSNNTTSVGLFFLVIAAIIGVPGAILFASADAYNRDTLPPLLKEWREKWVCLKCGTVYPVETSVTRVPREAANA